MNFKKTVLITGGATGIGRAISIKAAMAGYCVVINYNKSKQEAENLVNLIRENGKEAYCFCADISKYDQVEKMKAEMDALSLKPYALINNAGLSISGLFTDITEEQWKKLSGVNIDGTLNCCKAFLSNMIQQRNGRIINISSMWGIRGAALEVHYSVTKAAIIGLTRSLSKEVASSGVTVNCIAPGVIDTKMISVYSEDTIKDLIEKTPCGRLGTPTDIASAVMFLLGRESDFINGQIIGVDGGFTV